MTVLEVVERSNQRGGRMLSVLDLIDAGTLSLAQTAWLLGEIGAGASWLVGARPGGAGKTTIMAALLAMLPASSVVHLAASRGWRQARAGESVVAYEIGPGDYEAYVWGEELRALAALGKAGSRIVSNLHADTLEQAREQIVAQNGVPEEHFDRFQLFLPIKLTSGGLRTRPMVPVIWLHRDDAWTRVEEPALGPDEERIRDWLAEALGKPARSVEEVRASWLRFPDGAT